VSGELIEPRRRNGRDVGAGHGALGHMVGRRIEAARKISQTLASSAVGRYFQKIS